MNTALGFILALTLGLLIFFLVMGGDPFVGLAVVGILVVGLILLGLLGSKGRQSSSARRWPWKAASSRGRVDDLGFVFAVAAKFFPKLAEQGHVDAQFNLGFMYAKGLGVPQDLAEAAKWYRKAAEQGNAGAQNNLGGMYANGQGVPQDDAEAAKWYHSAAEQGNAIAQTMLGTVYGLGQGVPQDYTRSYMWFNLGASKLSGTGRETAVKGRDAAAGMLTPEQLIRAQQMARDWKPTKPGGK